ncbi:carbohydrate kinase family protein [Alteromonas halophila]|uniref:Fructokinase n=1 Tax=Alteromonas halophila TaxID=516698 RepID=A0A918JM40_9ALTE|nr:carbohydrate kinase [Alteromonas halophila]GGW84852.1 fructokinase [Alteromonas halophila]
MKPVICFGEALIDFLHVNTQTQAPLSLPEFRQYPGGAPANAAVAVARLGGDARFAGQVGDDPFGAFLGNALNAYGVNTDTLLTHPSAKTALAFVVLDETGDRHFSFHRHETADLLIEASQISPAWLPDNGIVHMCSNTLTAKPASQCTESLARQAAERGLLVSFDVNLRHNLWPGHQIDRDRVNALVHQAHLVKFSAEELAFLANGEESAYLATCLSATCDLILVTDGPAPVRIITAQGEVSLTPPDVNAVDTTAGGDAFVGGLLFALSHFLDITPVLNSQAQLEQVVTFAAHCGARAVTRQGAFTSLPSLHDITNALTESAQSLSLLPFATTEAS